MSLMSAIRIRPLLLVAAAVFPASSTLAQSELQMRVRQQPGWDLRAREGRCDIRVWVDNRAEVRMRGDTIFLRTVEGSRGRVEGSECSHPLPYNSVTGFNIRQTSGRSRLTLAQEPGRMNNYTAMILIEDRQGGGDDYAFEVTWRADNNITSAPAPFFDDVRACQDTVRQRFLSQNGRGSYIDFDGFADRRGEAQGNGFGRNNGRSQRGNRRLESIEGRGNARNFSESRDLTYECVYNTNSNEVVSGVYRYSGNSLRTNDRSNGRQLR